MVIGTDEALNTDAKVARLLAVIEGAIDSALPRSVSVGDEEFGAPRLIEAMRYSLQTPGKRIRPLLMLATADMLGVAADRLLNFAVAIEMIHAYSLIHDDLPSMDDDEMRRGRPTNHVMFGDGMAILAGDGLLTEAFSVMLLAPGSPKAITEVSLAISRAAGCQGMVGGQAADLLAEGRDPNEQMLTSIHRRKTGALLEVSVWAGARLAEAGDDEIAALVEFGRRFGLAFQIADDVKDEVAPEAVTGKHGGGDRASVKMTYPALHGIEGSRELCRQELAAAESALAPFGDDAAILLEVAAEAVAPAFEES